MTIPLKSTTLSAPSTRKSALIAMLNAGAVQPAREAATALSRAYPQDGFAPNILGLIAQEAGDQPAAITHFTEACRRTPDSADYGANLGYALTRSGRTDAASRLLARVVKAAPDHLNARINLVQALIENGKPREAIPQIARLRRQTGDTAEILRMLGTAHSRAGGHKPARKYLEKALAIDPASFEEYPLLGQAIESLEGPEAALATLRAFPPENALAQMELGDRLTTIGAFAEAATALEHALAQRPDLPRAYLRLGRLRKWRAGDPLLLCLEQLTHRPGLTQEARAEAFFALAKAYGDLGRHAESFTALSRANALFRSLVDYDVARNLAGMAKLPEVRFRPLSRSRKPQVRPVFILSLPRSGSTLVEQILSRHPDVTTLGEDSTVHLAATQAMQTGDLRKLARIAADHYSAQAQGRGIVTDKMLDNSLCVSALAESLPEARFIALFKAPPAAGYSLLRSPLDARGHPYTMDQQEVARYIAGHRRLMHRWIERYPGRILPLNYEDLVADPEVEIPRLLEHLGLPPCAACLAPERAKRPVQTLSVAQVRRGISQDYRDRWRPHADALAPMLAQLKAEGL